MIHRSFFSWTLLAFFIASLITAITLESKISVTTDLEDVIKRGEITIITRNTPTTYYIGPEGPTGFEYELARAFAKYLGITPTVIVHNEFSEILPAISRNEAQLAAAGITYTKNRSKYVAFTDSYQDITQLVLYKAGKKKPRTLQDLHGAIVDVIYGSSHEELLTQLKTEHNFLQWRANKNTEINDLLSKLAKGEIEYMICDSNDFEFNQRFYPSLRKGFQISEQQQLAWAFPKSKDRSLINAANEFLERSKNNGVLQKLYEKHYSHVPGLNYAGAQTFLQHINSRLLNLIPIFKQVATEHNLDWRFLAAVSYQESLWNPDAISPTGVRGLMMLTRRTARQLGIENRTDPLKSTTGGASYFLHIKKRIPARITEPDRTWMALAAYNVGFGHLEDARVLTQTRGGNPDRWADVRKTLPLLTQKEWYKDTKFGYARGHEPVLYVRNIRNYYDLLIWKYNEKDSLRDSLVRIIPKVM